MPDKLLSAADQRVLEDMLHLVQVAKGDDAWRSVEQLSASIGLCLECNELEPGAA